jgi:putative heme iron utilization protein
MSFRERLQRASERGKQARASQLNEAAAKALSEEECKRRHSQYRLTLTEHIEKCLSEMADNFPGFRMETVVDESGWGAVVSRDDIRMEGGRRGTYFSRLQLVVGPYNTYHVLDIAAKGTVRNKEVLTRTHYQQLADVDLQRFHELLEQWVLDYAELYSASV